MKLQREAQVATKPIEPVIGQIRKWQGGSKKQRSFHRKRENIEQVRWARRGGVKLIER